METKEEINGQNWMEGIFDILLSNLIIEEMRSKTFSVYAINITFYRESDKFVKHICKNDELIET